jgi:hypothetical protein
MPMSNRSATLSASSTSVLGAEAKRLVVGRRHRLVRNRNRMDVSREDVRVHDVGYAGIDEELFLCQRRLGALRRA